MNIGRIYTIIRDYIAIYLPSSYTLVQGCIVAYFGGIIGCMMYFIFPVSLADQQSVKVYDRHQVLLYDVRSQFRQSNYTSLSQIPKFITDSLITIEDHRFRNHIGIDIIGRCRSIYSKIVYDKRQGGSTIDQQVVKLSDAAFRRSRGQKLREIRGAFSLNITMNKSDILLYYVNHLNFRHGVKGFQTACQIFLGTPCYQLNQGQILYLIAMTKQPNHRDLAYYAYLQSQKIGLTGWNQSDFDVIHRSIQFAATNLAPHYVDYVLQYATGNTNIATTLDYGLSKSIDNILDHYRLFLLSKSAEDACIIVMNRNTDILSMNVLRSYQDPRGGTINGCIQPRQVGSVMKPFLYKVALQRQIITGGSMLDDSPVSYPLDNGGKYQPQNFDMQSHGPVTIGQALGSSLNVPAVKLLYRVGVDRYRSRLRQIGEKVKSDRLRDDDPHHYGLSLALGSQEISPLDVTRMRTTLLDQSDPIIGQIQDILSDNVNRILSFPQYNRFDRPGVFVKSGTSRGFVDGRVCGGLLSQDQIVCVRVGNYNGKPMKDSGYNTAGVLRSAVIDLLEK